jgi:hypothetical protein
MLLLELTGPDHPGEIGVRRRMRPTLAWIQMLTLLGPDGFIIA